MLAINYCKWQVVLIKKASVKCSIPVREGFTSDGWSLWTVLQWNTDTLPTWTQHWWVELFLLPTVLSAGICHDGSWCEAWHISGCLRISELTGCDLCGIRARPVWDVLSKSALPTGLDLSSHTEVWHRLGCFCTYSYVILCDVSVTVCHATALSMCTNTVCLVTTTEPSSAWSQVSCQHDTLCADDVSGPSKQKFPLVPVWWPFKKACLQIIVFFSQQSMCCLFLPVDSGY